MQDLSILLNEIPVAKLKEIATNQHFHRIRLTGEVAANDSFPDKLEIASGWHFVCLFITGAFTTLNDIGAGVIDDGIDHLVCTAIMQGDTKEFWADEIPLSHFLTPGRRKDVLVGAAAASALLASPPVPFIAWMPAGNTIAFKFTNDAGYLNKYDLTFHGIRVRA